MNKEKYTQLTELLRASASADQSVADKAKAQFLALAEEPLNDGVFDGPVIFDKVFKRIDTRGDYNPRFSLHFVTPGTEDDYIAYTIPKCGAIPYRSVVGDEILVNTYRVGNSIDACKHFIENARYDVIEEMTMAFNSGFTMRLNADAQHALAGAAVGRGLTDVTDTAATAGVFTFALVSKMMTEMLRQGGGNMSSTNGFRLTDMLISPEAMGDLRALNVDNWTIDRYKVLQDKGTVYNLFGVNFTELVELGAAGTLQDYMVNTLGHALTGGDLEFCLGLDLTDRSRRNFVMPVAKNLTVKDDPYLDRLGRWGFYGDMWVGFGVLDARGVIIGSF